MILAEGTAQFNKFLAFHVLFLLSFGAEAKCKSGCSALASYYVWEGSNLTYISYIFGRKIPEILAYNPSVKSSETLLAGIRINVPFVCDCLNGDFLGHTFTYITQHSDTYNRIAQIAFANLTTEQWLQRVNNIPATRIPDLAHINVTVNCSCGVKGVSTKYGLFMTYSLRPGESLSSLAAESNVTATLLMRYNQDRT